MENPSETEGEEEESGGYKGETMMKELAEAWY
jgi:hypothetical protein